MDFGDKDHQAEGLGDIIVGSDIIAVYHVNLRVHGSQEEDKDIALPADLCTEVQTAPVREGDVADDQVRMAAVKELTGFGDSKCGEDVIPFPGELQGDASF